MNALTATVLICAIAAVIFSERRTALFVLVAASIVLTRGQAIDIGGFNMYPGRLVMLAGGLRVATRGELAQIGWNGLDRIVIIAYLYVTAIFVLRTMTGSGTTGIAQISVTDKIGTFADVGIAYISMRSLLRDSDDLVRLFSALVFVLVPYVGLLGIERATGLNPFSALGGFGQIWSDLGRLRCRGSFMHPSLLGTFGASLVPVYIGIIFSRKRIFLSAIGLLCALAIVSLANSGGPWILALTTLAAWALWPVRKHMRLFRYGLLAMFVMLAVVMKAPIWYLPSKLSDFSGGDGWHRSYLMDQTLRHWSDWWLAGMPLNEAKQWFPYLVKGGLDITNLFVAFGLDSGLLGIGLLIAIFVVAYSRLGRVLRAQPPPLTATNDIGLICWALGAALTGHLVNFFAITYFDQTYVLWLLLLAAIARLSSTDVVIAAPERPRQPPLDRRKKEVAAGQLEHPTAGLRRLPTPTTRTLRRSP